MNRCLYLNKEHELFLKNEEIPKPKDGEAVVQIKANGICGSDIHFYQTGRLGLFRVEEPYVPGHEACGIVHTTGGGVTGLKAGDRVVIEPGIPCGVCDLCRAGRYNICRNLKFLSVPGINGTFCDYLTVPAHMLHLMPEGMSFELGALVEPLSVASHAVNRSGNVKGKTAVILGAGPIGLFLLQAYKASGGGKVIMIDIVEGRLNTALNLGADEAINGSKLDKTPEDMAEVVFETAGSAVTTAQMIPIAQKGGTIVQVGHPPNSVLLDIALMNQKELNYYGSLDYSGEFRTSIMWLSDKRVNGEAMISHRFDFSDAPEAFAFTAVHRETVIKTVITN